MIIMDCI